MEEKIKTTVQRWVVSVSILLMVGKFIAYWLTNSVGVLTDAMESIVNVVAGLITLYSLWISARPRDQGHPFGHGKVELLSASFEGIMIIVAGGLIIYQGSIRLFEPAQIHKLDIGIIIVTAAGVVNYIMGAISIRIGKKNNSIALIAGGKHLQSDTYSTIGLVVGLILLMVTGLTWIDSVLAIIFGTIIMVTGIGILRKTIDNIMDKADLETLETMVQVIQETRPAEWIDIHNTKTLKHGSYIFVDCDLTLPWYFNIIQSHDNCERLRDSMMDRFGGKMQITIHSDPCTYQQCGFCAVADCQFRKSQLSKQHELTFEMIIQSDEQRNEYPKKIDEKNI